MRVSREKMQQHRERILEAAAALFRERGLDGVGVAEVMATVGLTHGGFYRHFASKDELAARACARAFEQALARLRRRSNVTSHAAGYLTERHRDQPAQGCPIACFAAQIADSAAPVRTEFVDGLMRYLDLLAERLPRERAIALVASLVGALLLARATAVEAPELSAEILAAMREALSTAGPGA